MTDFVIGKVGRILAGKEAGRYVKFLDDAEGSGGYLILTSDLSDFHTGFDNWVANKEHLASYMRDAGWKIEWMP